MNKGKGKRKESASASKLKGERQSKTSADGDVFPLLADEILESFPEPLLLFDTSGNILLANGSAAESLGFDPSGLLAEELSDRTDPFISDQKDEEGEDLRAVFSAVDRTVRNAICIFRTENGEIRRTIASSAPVLYQGARIGMIATWHDITEQVEREDLVILARDTLEGILVDRTCELLESREQLERQRRLSDLGTLAATVAHELRNPLGVIRTAVYNIRRKNGDPSLERHIANIDKKIEESSMIINNILNYSRINEPVIKSVRLADVIVDCISSVRKRYHMLPVKINRRLRGISGLEIRADEGQLKEIFLNVINNAVEAIEGTGSVTVTAYRSAEGKVTIEVTDNGIGISEKSLEKVFDPFFSDKAKGTGLGLAVCSKLVDLHSGSISIKSGLGKGTTVTVSLPVKGE
jgi:PAS domain S-box-containing protein